MNHSFSRAPVRIKHRTPHEHWVAYYHSFPCAHPAPHIHRPPPCFSYGGTPPLTRFCFRRLAHLHLASSTYLWAVCDRRAAPLHSCGSVRQTAAVVGTCRTKVDYLLHTHTAPTVYSRHTRGRRALPNVLPLLLRIVRHAVTAQLHAAPATASTVQPSPLFAAPGGVRHNTEDDKRRGGRAGVCALRFSMEGTTLTHRVWYRLMGQDGIQCTRCIFIYCYVKNRV